MIQLTLYQHPTLPGLFLTRGGRVFRELPTSTDANGYQLTRITSGANTQVVRRHTLVAETFIGPRPPGHGVRHLDGDPGNDNPRNLAWGTQAENSADTVQHGRSTRGIKNRHAKLTEAEAREIKHRRAAGESGRSLAREFNISEQTVCCIHTGRQWSWLAGPQEAAQGAEEEAVS